MSEHQALIWIEDMQMKPRHTVSLKMRADGARLYLFIDNAIYRVSTTARVDLRLIDLVQQMKAKLADAGVTP